MTSNIITPDDKCVNKCIWLIGNIYSPHDKEIRQHRFDELKKLKYPIISKHYVKEIPLFDVIKELCEATKTDTRVLIMHYHDEIRDYDKIIKYMNSSDTIVSYPIFRDTDDSLKTIPGEFCLSGLICNSSKISTYIKTVYNPKTTQYMRWIDMISHFNSNRDDHIIYNICHRDESMEVELVKSLTDEIKDKFKKFQSQIPHDDNKVTEAVIKYNIQYFSLDKNDRAFFDNDRNELLKSVNDYRRQATSYPYV